jgi:tripartite-type tricarboxylate transporter receptor subunit TctC
MQRRQLLLASAAVLAVPTAAAVVAQTGSAGPISWPLRPIKLLVPFPGGSSPDLIARVIAEPLALRLGQPVVVFNQPGAGGNIGTAAAATASPDGYTLLFTIQGPLVTAPLLNPRLNYDPQRDLRPISLVATSPNVLVIDAQLGVGTLADFIRVAKARHGALNYGSVGNGSAAHLAMEAFKARAGVELAHVPYQGFPQVVNAMLAGQVQAAFMVPGIAMAQVRAGKLVALGVTSLGRVAALPELPTVAEQGFAGFEATSWQAVLAPAKTPDFIVERLARELSLIIRSEAVRGRLLSQYFSAVGSSPEGLANLMRSDRRYWAGVIQVAGIKPD